MEFLVLIFLIGRRSVGHWSVHLVSGRLVGGRWSVGQLVGGRLVGGFKFAIFIPPRAILQIKTFIK